LVREHCETVRTGPVKAKLVAGQKRRVLAQLITCSPVHEIEVYALQAGLSDKADDTQLPTRRCQTILASLKLIARSFGGQLDHLDGSLHEADWQWEMPRGLVQFSIVEAISKGEAARDLLTSGQASSAFDAAVEALQIDTLAVIAHEVVCEAAVKIGLVKLSDAQRKLLDKSAAFLGDRAGRFGLMGKLGRLRAATNRRLHDQSRLPIMCNGWFAEQERLTKLLEPVREHLDSTGEKAEKRRINGLIEELRNADSLGADPLADPRVQNVLTCDFVRRSQGKIGRQSKMVRQQADALIGQVTQAVYKLILDPTCPCDIDKICRQAVEMVFSAYKNASATQKRMLKLHRQRNDVCGHYYAEHGCEPTQAHLRNALKCTEKQWAEYANWLEARRANDANNPGETQDDTSGGDGDTGRNAGER